MSAIERQSHEEPMPAEASVNVDEQPGCTPSPGQKELARRAPAERMPPPPPPMSERALPPDTEELARRDRTPTPDFSEFPDTLHPPPMPGRALPPATELARRDRTPLFLPNSRGPTPFDFSGPTPFDFSGSSDLPDPSPLPGRALPPDNEELERHERTPAFLPDSQEAAPFDSGSREPTPMPIDASPEIDASRKRARSSSADPPRKRRKPRSVARFFDLAAEDSDDSEPQRADEDADGREGEEDDEETTSDREFIDDEPVHQGSYFTIPKENDAAALEALAASFKAVPATAPSAVSPTPSSSTSTSSHDLVRKLLAPASSDEPATIQRGEWIRLKQKPHEGKLAWVVTNQRFIIAESDRVGDADPCSRLTYNVPLRPTAYVRVLPNHNELLPFKQSKEKYFKQATFIGTTPALVEGVRVVVVAGEHEGSVGYIVAIREIADEKYRIFVPIAQLRRHALDPPTPFRTLDRVQVVTGIEHRGAIGRIIQIDDQWLSIQCTLESGQENIIEVEHRRVTRHFMVGDFVCITGAFKACRGLVVKVCTGGALELYTPQQDSGGEDPLWRVPSRDVNFGPGPDTSISSWSALMPQPGISNIQAFSAQTAVGEDIQRQQQMREGKPVGRRYEGMEVLVGWHGPFKGMRGVVVGDFDSADRAARIQKRKRKPVKDDNGIMVTVQKEGSNTKFTLEIETLVHLHTGIPLSKTRALPRWMLAPQLVPSSNLAGTPVPSRSPMPLAALSSASNSRLVDGELDGRWLCLPGLAHKRVDVILKDIVGSENRYFRPKKRILGCEGRSGYLALDLPFREEDLNQKTIRVWAVGPNGTNHPVRGPCIRPMRYMADGTPINQVVTRVVIIGPDIAGDVSQLGCYGEARPHNDEVVVVKMRWSKEQRRAAAQPLSYEHTSETIPDVRNKTTDHLPRRGEILFPNGRMLVQPALPPRIGHIGFDSYTTFEIDPAIPVGNEDRLPDGGTIFDIERTEVFHSNRQSRVTHPSVEHEFWSLSRVTKVSVEPPSHHEDLKTA
ncbi:hypothetical protein MVEN_00030300 [Mycena venus]|uniref:Uncharacterized protein n=1 Tax=Mycena venus TaxID=2733690 RepID=A0A8H6Z3P2_9AGAR|nr:hypothetical protein MVEN_00030300 [Mycena venus]